MFHFVFDNKYQLNKHLIVYQFDWFLKWNKKKEKEEKKNQIKIIINNNNNKKKHKHTTTAIFHNWTNFRSVSILFWFRKTTHLSTPLIYNIDFYRLMTNLHILSQCKTSQSYRVKSASRSHTYKVMLSRQ